mgnify:CR=1 FL=1
MTHCGDRSCVALALRARQAAKLLNVCQKTLWSWTKSGVVPHVRVGRAVLYPVDLLQDWLRQQAARQQAAAVEQAGGRGDGVA